jgi:hypothetical protein
VLDLDLGWELFDSPWIFLKQFGFQVVSRSQARSFLRAAIFCLRDFSAELENKGAQRDAHAQFRSCARMRAAINLQNFLRIDARIGLSRRERFVSEQVLDRAQVAAIP